MRIQQFTVATILSVLTASVLAMPVDSATAAGWGSLSGKFVFDGKTPAPTAIKPTKDTEFCGKFNIVAEDLVVGEDGGLANVVVMLNPGRGDKVQIHEDYKSDVAGSEVVIDNKGCQFVPHIAALWTEQKLVVKNSDMVPHNTNCALLANSAFNDSIGIDDERVYDLKKPERVPANNVNCNIHPWMAGYLVVRDHPYIAVSAADGTFEIKNLPDGEHEFLFWHERPGYLKALKTDAGATSRRGRLKIKIKDGETVDLGEVKVPAKMLPAK